MAEVERRDFAICMVEYDGKGQIVTVISRAHTFGNNLLKWRGWGNYEMAYLYLGNTTRMIKHKIDNREFEANFIALL